MSLILKMEFEMMLGFSTNFQLFDLLMLLQPIIIFIVLFLLLYFLIVKYIILEYLLDEKNKYKHSDELSLIYANKGISNSVVCMWSCMIMYVLFYIMI
jgi:phage shock protein PspC (stress-responsive transcriptional regulator)